MRRVRKCSFIAIHFMGNAQCMYCQVCAACDLICCLSLRIFSHNSNHALLSFSAAKCCDYLLYSVPDSLFSLISSYSTAVRHSGFMVCPAVFYARTMKIPLVMSYHTHLPSYAINYLGFIPGIEKVAWEVIRFFHSRADLTLVTSPQMRDELTENGITNVDVWRKGIDTERFDPKFKSAEMRHQMSDGHTDDFLMVYVGRLGAEKRLKDIKAMLAEIPEARLCIVGKGPHMEELQTYFEGTKTKFMGQLSGDALSQAFASADVFIMPSDSETLGFVVLESMASGVPVVGAKAGGIPNLIEHGENGFLVDPGDTNEYVAKLKQLQVKGFREKMGKAARKEAERWGWEAATSVLRNIQYEKALVNFHSRVFDGLERQKSSALWRFFTSKIRRFLKRVRRTLGGKIVQDDEQPEPVAAVQVVN
jgi:sulfoquinovosyltransferase